MSSATLSTENPHQYHCDYAMCRPTGPEPEEGEEAEMDHDGGRCGKKRQVQEYVSMFCRRRLSPQAHPAPGDGPDPVGGGLHQGPPRRESEEFCFIDLGYLSTRIFVVQGDRIKTTRRIPVGCRQLDSVVADVLNVDGFFGRQL